MDGEEGAEYDEIALPRSVFSPDSRRTAYAARRARRAVVVVDGQEQPEYDDIGQGHPTFSPDGRVAYVGIRQEKRLLRRARGRHAVVLEGQVVGEYDAVAAETPVFSADGQHMAYEATRDGRAIVVLDGREGSGHDGFVSACGLHFEPDGSVRYMAIKEQSFWRVTQR